VLASVGYLKPVTRLATPAELAIASKRGSAVTGEESAWLKAARSAIGLPVAGPIKTTFPNLPAIPPVSGTATSAEQAQAYGAVWWRLYKTTGDPDEAEAFRDAARGWYRQRDALLG